MDASTHRLEQMGFDHRLHEQMPENRAGVEVARVVSVHKDRFTVHDGETDVPAELLGKIAFGAGSPFDFPTVGDWVRARFFDDRTLSIIHDIFPRKSLLKRKTPGRKIEFQLIGANIDTAFIVQSLDENFNLRRLERYLVMIHESGIEPVALLSKSDLLNKKEIETRISEVNPIMPHLTVLPFSNKTESGMDRVKSLLAPGRTYCLLGSSGVGKTSLLNHLIGEPALKTRTVRAKDGKGRHATTSRQLILLDSGAMLIDTPGMRELGHVSVEKGLEDTFAEIEALAGRCRFSDCSHVAEKGCAVLSALEEGRLSEERYRNYAKMRKESAYGEMSYVEKRRKEKQFGKLCKSVMKHKKGG